MSFTVAFSLLLVLIVNDFLNIGPWWKVSGVFNVADVGNGLLWLLVLPVFAFSKNKKILFNPVTGLVIFYISFVLLQVLLAREHYGQSLFDGLLGVRHQFYYLSFFLFLLLFDDLKKITTFLNILVGVALIAFLIGIINYYGPTIISHKWAEGHRVRAGVVRAYIPAMDLITFATLWLFANLQADLPTTRRPQKLFSVLLIAAHIFRQSRMRLIALVTVIVAQMAYSRRWKKLITLLLAGGVVFAGFELYKGNNMLYTIADSAYTDVVEKTGTMTPRLAQLEVDFQEFLRHPWMGSGAVALRRPTAGKNTPLQMRTAELSYYHDLGYTHWLKFYGITGAAWLLFFSIYQFSLAHRIKKRCTAKEKILLDFAVSYFGFAFLSFFTLVHFMVPSRIILVTFCAALLLRLRWRTENPPVGDEAVE